MKRELLAVLAVLLALPSLGVAQEARAAMRRNRNMSVLTEKLNIKVDTVQQAAAYEYLAKSSQKSLTALQKAYPEHSEAIAEVKEGLSLLASNLSNKSSNKYTSYQAVFFGLEALAKPVVALQQQDADLANQVIKMLNHKYYFAFEEKAYSLKDLALLAQEFFSSNPYVEMQYAAFYASLPDNKVVQKSQPESRAAHFAER